MYQAGLIPNIRDAVIVAHDGHIELDFQKVRPVRVLAKLSSARATEKQCEQAIQQDDNDNVSRLVHCTRIHYFDHTRYRRDRFAFPPPVHMFLHNNFSDYIKLV